MKGRIPEIREEILVDDENALLSINPSLTFINVIWKKWVPLDNRMAYFDKVLHLSTRQNLQYLLIDARIVSFMEVEEQNWIVSLVSAIKERSSIRRIARVNATHCFELMDVFALKDRIDRLLTSSPDLGFEIFDDPSLAFFWLLEEKKALEPGEE